MLRWTGRAAGKGLHLLVRVLFGLAILVLLGMGALAWRLSEGPIALPWLAHRIEAAVNEKGGPTRLSIGGASLEWQGFRLGVDHPVDVNLTALRVIDAKGAVLDQVSRLAVSVALPPLLVGHVAPRTVEAEGLRLHLVRAADGTVSVALGSLTESLDSGAPPRPQPRPEAARNLLAELSGPPQKGASAHGGGMGALRLDQLRRVLVHDAALTVTDKALGADWRLDIPVLDLTRQAAGGITGEAQAALGLGDAHAQITAKAELAAGGGSTRLTATLSPITPAAFAPALPGLAPLAGIALPVGGSLAAELGPDLGLRHFVLQAQAAAGRLHLGPADEAITSATITAEGDLQAAEIKALHVVLTAPDGSAGPALDLHGGAKRQAGRFTAQAVLDFDRVPFADLARYWPAGTGGGGRPWVTQNITAGTAHDGHVAIALDGPADFSDATLRSVTGQLQGDDLTVYWLRPMPPIEHAAARLTIVGPDVVEIASQGGHVAVGGGGITLGDGAMRIWGLTAKDQFSTIAVGASGAIPDLLTLLSNKRLNLLSKHKLPVQDPAGTFTGRLDVQLPLDNRVTIDQIGIKGQAALAGVHLGNVVAGRDIDDGAFDLAVDNDGLKLGGKASLAHIPCRLDVALDFRAGPPTGITTTAKVSGTATAAQLTAAGLDTVGVVQGAADLDATYTQARSGAAAVQADADLRQAALDAGALGWTKRAGEAASARARIVLAGDRLASIEDVSAEAPGLSLRGRADFAAGAPSTLVIERGVIGRTDLTGRVQLATRPGEPIQASVTGRQLDLSGRMKRKQAEPARKPASEHPGPPWQVSARFDRVLLAADHVVGPMTMSAQSDGRVVRVARLDVAGAVRLLATIGPGGPNAGRVLRVTSEDTGSVLQALDLTDAIRGGRLSLTGQFDDRRADHPLAGNAELTGFRFADAPAIARVLQAMTLYGLISALRGPGLQVDRLIAPFRLDGDLLSLDDARAFNSALGVTAKGSIDIAAGTANLQGTIVPAYMLNSFLGNIPLIGRLFSPEQGGGVFAVSYGVRGKLADPAVSVNPLSALTPGFLRGLFGVFQTAPAK